MKPVSLIPIVLLAALALGGCSGDESATSESKTMNVNPEKGELAKIPILPGYKYYVGGPIMKKDAYGRYRLHKFEGEVEQPPSRGMIFGAKFDGDKLEYKVWGNGRLLGYHRGVMRDGVFWQEYAEAYRKEVLVAREVLVHDDEAMRSKVTSEDIDPETGEVIRKREGLLSYRPMKDPDDPEDEWFNDDEEDEEEGEGDGEGESDEPAEGQAAKKVEEKAAPAASDPAPAANEPQAGADKAATE